jgi:hypothetical protein
MAVMDKRLLISKSRGDSNQCTLGRGKLDQNDTYASHANLRTPCVRFLWAVPVRDGCTAFKKKCSRLHLSARLSGQRDPAQFLSQHSH